MAQSYASLKKLVLKIKLSPGDSSFTADRDIGVTKGRILFKSSTGATTELISFSGVAASGSNYVYSNLTRDLSETTDPATSTSTGETWKAGSTGYLVAMHDQIVDKNEVTTFRETVTVSNTAVAGFKAQNLTTAQRDAIASPANGDIIYNTTTGEFNVYQAGVWTVLASGSTQPNASATVAGKVEIATTAQSVAGTDTGETGALLSTLPSDIAKNTQSGTFVYTSSADVSDTYTANLTPALTAYTTGMKVRVKFTTANTGACTININSLGAKSIKTRAGNDPSDGDIAAGSIREFIYDGTNFVIDYNQATIGEPGSVEMATDAEVTTGTDQTRYINPKQAKDNYNVPVSATATITFSSFSDPSGTFTNSATYVKLKQATCAHNGTYEISYTYKSADNVSLCSFRLYKNGVALGTEKTTTSATPASWAENLAFVTGDTIEIWAKTAGAGAAQVTAITAKGNLDLVGTFA